VEVVFLVVGGGAMILNDALKKSGLRYICCHHEQACAIAAEGYARTSGRMAVFCVTSGPGGTNALTGVVGAYLDSSPILGLSGQIRTDCLKSGNLRQLGDQEADIISIVKPITKYAKLVTQDIEKELKKAIQIATSGRPGPVWLDIPLDYQGTNL
jgi:acetolactate synthase-1/2/3 large subunit